MSDKRVRREHRRDGAVQHRRREILVVNSEYTNRPSTCPTPPDGTPTSLDDVRILQNLQGVSVMEIAEGENGWEVVVDSPYNRRITTTRMTFDGPAAGHDLLKTAADPTGMLSLGTFNNCGSGRTPWGTYLTCEENFNGYFGSTEQRQDEATRRQRATSATASAPTAGATTTTNGTRASTLSVNPNEPHRAGYIVEIDPADPTSTPVKHTALGRFKHENAAYAIAPDGRVVVYMGDDERGEFMYKWVSRDAYVRRRRHLDAALRGHALRAVFDDDQTGEWTADARDHRHGYGESRSSPAWRGRPWAPPRWTAPSGSP
jgi:secreted PhoX family phosphatase